MINGYPTDSTGSSVKPFDLVKVGEIPPHYWADEATAILSEYRNTYGIITYYDNQYLYYGRHAGWFDEINHVNVKCVRISSECLSSYDFWLPCDSISRLPPNVILNTIFLGVPLQLERPDGKIEMTIGRGGQLYNIISRIIQTPFEEIDILNTKLLSELFPPSDE